MIKCNKFISLLLVMLLLPVFTVSAAAEEYTLPPEIELLTEIGVISESDSAKPESENISRAEFAEVLVKLAKAETLAYSYYEKSYSYDVSSDYYESGYINAAIMMNLMDYVGDGVFGPTKSVTYIEAVKGAVRLLGYDAVVKDESDAAYILAAQRAGILSGVNKDEDGLISRGTLYRLIANSLDTNIIGAAGMGENDSVIYEKGDTLLAEYHDIYETEGVISATKYGALNGEEPASGNSIRIDGTEYSTGGAKYTDLIGYRVVLYYKNDGLSRDVVFAVPDRNDVLTISADKIDSFSKRTYTYYDEDDSTETISTLGATVFYNGASAEGTSFRAVPEQGEVVFVDNNRDGEYDIVSVWDYTDYIVAAIDAESSKIYVKHDNALNFEDYDEVSLYDSATGEEKSFAELTEGDIISVLSDSNAAKAVIYVSRETVTGMVDRITTDDKTYVAVNEAQYTYAKLYEELLAQQKVYGLEIGGNYKLSLNHFGKIAEAESLGNYMSDFSFGIAVAAQPSKVFGDDIAIRIFTQLGVFETFNIAENCEIDEVNYKKPADAYKQFFKNGENGTVGESFVAQALRFKINEENELTDIDLAGEKNENKKSLYLMYDATENRVKYMSAYSALAVTSTDPAIGLTGTIMLKAPIKGGVIDGSDQELFGADAISNYSNSANIKGLLYKTDNSDVSVEFFVTAITLDELTGKEVTEVDDEATVNLFLESYRGLNSEGDEVTMIRYSPDGTVKTAALDPAVNLDAVSVSNDAVATHKLEAGDIFRFKKNSKDEIVKIEAGYDYSEDKFLGTNYVYAGQSPDINLIWRPSEPMYLTRINVERYQNNYIRAVYKDPALWDGNYDDMMLISAKRNSVLSKAIIYDGEKNEVSGSTGYQVRDWQTVGADCSKGLYYRRYGDPRKLIFFK